MLIRVKNLWTAALRSNEYEQCNGYLCDTSGYCCWGVLCDLAVRESVIPYPRREDGFRIHMLYGPNYLDGFRPPQEVIEWSELDEFVFVHDPYGLEPTGSDPEGKELVRWQTVDYFVGLNDRFNPFPVIADEIDRLL